MASEPRPAGLTGRRTRLSCLVPAAAKAPTPCDETKSIHSPTRKPKKTQGRPASGATAPLVYRSGSWLTKMCQCNPRSGTSFNYATPPWQSSNCRTTQPIELRPPPRKVHAHSPPYRRRQSCLRRVSSPMLCLLSCLSGVSILPVPSIQVPALTPSFV